MKIAITSGKGGSGKTFAATCLAKVLSRRQTVDYIDCDVEGANAYLFIKPEDIEEQPQLSNCITSVDMDKCVLCGKCGSICFMNAIVVGKENVMVFEELCRYCGACEVVCNQQAMVKGTRQIGKTFSGTSGNINIKWAELATGSGGMTTKLIDELKSNINDGITILDSPPGTSCPSVHTVQEADITIIVCDPTVFSVHDMKLSVGMCRSMGIEPLILINRAELGDLKALTEWCDQENLEILVTLPDSREIAEKYSRGEIAVDTMPEIRAAFEVVADKILQDKPEKSKPVFSKGVFLAEPNGRISNSGSHNNKAIEITVLSGKGGSGKTSLAGCLAILSGGTVADCDVDAADMHLIFEPEVVDSKEFTGGQTMHIDTGKCHPCGDCIYICKFDAVERTGTYGYHINEDKCEGCGACVELCPRNAISGRPGIDGQWYESNIRCGKMSHATLTPGKSNSGKLVTLVRNKAGQLISENSTVIIDGSPGTGCPVIASVGGVKYVVLVAEPTVSGLHDLKMIYDLCRHFKLPAGIVINKADLNEQMSNKIESYAEENNIDILGHIKYDEIFYEAMKEQKTVIEYNPESIVAKDIKAIWQNIQKFIRKN